MSLKNVLNEIDKFKIIESKLTNCTILYNKQATTLQDEIIAITLYYNFVL